MILERADGALEGCLREIRRALADRGGETLRLIRHARVEPRPPCGLPRRLCIDRRSQRRLVQLIFRRDGGDHAVDVRRARRRRPVARHEKFRQQRVHPLALQRSMREADRAVLLPQHGREQQRAIEAVALTIHEHAGGTTQDAAVRDPEGVAADPRYLDIFVPPGKTKHLSVETTKHAFAYVFEGSGTFSGASQPLGVLTERDDVASATLVRERTGNR